MDSEFFRSLADRISEFEEPNEPDVIQINVPAFLRIIELVREDINDDVPLHYLTEILVQLSSQGVVDMQDYDEIYQYTMQDSKGTKHNSEEENSE